MLQLINKYVPTNLISSLGPKPMWMNSATLKAVIILKPICNLFWKYVRSCTKARGNGSPTESDYEAANILNTFFTSVFTNESLSDIPSLPDRSIEKN